MERDWVDYASAIGNTATALTLIVVLIKEYKTRKDIQDLTVIAKELQRQNALQATQMKNSVKPDVACSTIGYQGSSVFRITVLNYSETLNVTRVISEDNSGFHFQPIEVPLQFSRHNPIELAFKPSGSATIRDWIVNVEISATDIYNNRYMLIITGNYLSSKIEVYEDEDEETASGML